MCVRSGRKNIILRRWWNETSARTGKKLKSLRRKTIPFHSPPGWSKWLAWPSKNISKRLHILKEVEKELNGHKISVLLIIDKVNSRNIEWITTPIKENRNKNLSDQDIDLYTKTSHLEQIYYILPGYFRRFLIRHTQTVFSKMGNFSIISIRMMGEVNRWFIPISVYPTCFRIGTIYQETDGRGG